IFREAKVDGPYNLFSVALSRVDGTTVYKSDVVPAAHTTKPYKASDFSDQPFNDPEMLKLAEKYDAVSRSKPPESAGARARPPRRRRDFSLTRLADALPALRIGGTGPVLDRLGWDVKLYLALNGALHDAAIVAWSTKRKYDFNGRIMGSAVGIAA